MAKSETLNLRVSAEFKRRLAGEAAKVKRSVTNYLEVTLTELWDRRDASESQSSRKKAPRD
jgi:predicted HicB family RNase H-like nuclease